MERPFTGRRREEEPPRRFGREGRAHWRLRRWNGEDCFSEGGYVEVSHISREQTDKQPAMPRLTNRREVQRAGRGAAALASYGSKLGASGVGGKGRL